jgi:hypothetical protein
MLKLYSLRVIILAVQAFPSTFQNLKSQNNKYYETDGVLWASKLFD